MPLDYAPIYRQTTQFTLKLIRINLILRMVLGAFCTSPALSLCAEGAVLPVLYQTLLSSANVLTSAAQSLDLPIYIPALSPENRLLLRVQSIAANIIN